MNSEFENQLSNNTKCKCPNCSTEFNVNGGFARDNFYYTYCPNCNQEVKVTELTQEKEGKTFDNNNSGEPSKYPFVWEPEGKLRHIDDKTLRIGFNLLELNFVTELSITEDNTIKYVCKDINTCSENANVNEWYEKCKATTKTSYNTRTMSRYIGTCGSKICGFELCPSHLAAYLKYLTDTHKLDEYLTDRIEYRKKGHFANSPYDFEWNPVDGLKNINETDFMLASKFVDAHLIDIRPYLKDSNIETPFHRICSQKTKSYHSLSQKIDSLNFSDVNRGIWYTMSTNANFRKPTEEACLACPSTHCMVAVAAYIKYLRDTNQEEKILQDRLYYQENKESVLSVPKKSPFDFSLPADLFTGVSRDSFEVAQLMLDKGLVTMDYNKNKEENYNVIHTCGDWCSYTNLQQLKQAILDDSYIRKNKNTKAYMTRPICVTDGNPQCNQPVCIHKLAAYLDYLNKTGLYSEYLKNREKIKSDVTDSMSYYESKIPQIKTIMRNAENEKENSLYCIIEGDKGVGKTHLLENIATLLYSKGKIKNDKYTYQTLQQVSEFLTQHPTKQPSGESGFNYLSSGYTYHNLAINELYVLDGITDFFNDYQYLKQNPYGLMEERRKCIPNLVKTLTQYKENTYVIIIGTKKEIESLFEIDIRFKYLFGDNVISLENLTAKEIYDIYKTKLSQKNLDMLHKSENDFYNLFINFVALNDKYLPFKNIELANYLAKYSNDQDKLKLPPDIYDKTTIDQMFKNLIGMNDIKNKLHDFEKFVMFKKKAEANGINIPNSNLHMLFTGNPGTGKTVTARIVSKILYNLGIIPENKLLEVESKDLIAGYTGQTAIKTAEVIEKAMGGVLFIDEAYSLSESGYGKEAVATLIKAMEDNKDKFVVIFAGYNKEMNEFLELNTGIKSRIGYTFNFEDYTADELFKIFETKLNKNGFIIDGNANEKIKNTMAFFCDIDNFGNGRFVDKVIQNTLLKHSNNYDNNNIAIINEDDIPNAQEIIDIMPEINTAMLPTNMKNNSSIDALFNSMVGMDDIKEKLNDFKNFALFKKKAKANGITIPSSNTHMLFTGNPGTGKTVTARIVAKILYDIGVIPKNKITEVESKDLIAEYIGQTAVKTAEVIEKAMGGVLFIDEAYMLNDCNGRGYGKEAVATLIKAMEDHKHEFVVIFAGYTSEMGEFLDINTGIRSRIGYTFNFKDYNDEELTEIFLLKLKKSGFIVEDYAAQKVKKIMKYFHRVENFGNGRFVDNVIQNTLLKHAKIYQDSDINIITENDIPDIKELSPFMPEFNVLADFEEINNNVLERVAYHELGHAIVQQKLFPNKSINKITIEVDGTSSLGYVQLENTKAQCSTRQVFIDRIAVCMAGLAAEEVFLNEYASGGYSDLTHATDIAKTMVMYSGMSKRGFAIPEKITNEINDEINDIIQEAYEKATSVIKNNYEKLQKSKELLMVKHTLSKEEIAELFS